MYSQDFSVFETFVNKNIPNTVPGLVVAFGQPGRMFYNKAFGKREITPHSLPMSPDTLFDIASITKSVSTASLTMLLESSGVLSAHDKVQKFIPHAKNTWIGSTPISRLLCHQSGLAAWRPFFLKITGGNKANLVPSRLFSEKNKDIVINMILSEKPAYHPGTEERYSDLGYILLGKILEEAANCPLERLFKEKIAEPMGLHSTVFRPITLKKWLADKSKEDISATEVCPWREQTLIGHVHDDNAFILGGAAGHAGLFSTTSDLFNFTSKMFNIYKLGTGYGISQKVLREYWKKKDGGSWVFGWDTPTPGKSTSGNCFSLNSVGAIGFTGCTIWLDLDKEFIIILLSNRIHPTRHANPNFGHLRQDIYDCIMQNFSKIKESEE